jgi:hypothetical protein
MYNAKTNLGEKKMRAKTLLAAAAALALGAASAQATFTINVEVLPGTGSNLGKNLIYFRAQGDGVSTHLQGTDAALTALEPEKSLYVRRGLLDADNVFDYDINFINNPATFTYAKELDEDELPVPDPAYPSPRTVPTGSTSASNARVTSFIRADPTKSFNAGSLVVYTITALTPTNNFSEPTFTRLSNGDIDTDTIVPTKDPEVNFDPEGGNPNATKGLVKSIRATGAWLNDNTNQVNHAPLAQGAGGGVLFAMAVVDGGASPGGAVLSFPDAKSGLGDQNPLVYRFDGPNLLINGGVNVGTSVPGYTATVVNGQLVVAVPEPGSIAVLGLGALGLLGRRRRA